MSSTWSFVACGPASTCAASPGISFIVRNTTTETPTSTGIVASSRSMPNRSISGAERHRPEGEHVGVRVDEPFDFLVPRAGGFLVDDEHPRGVVHDGLLDLEVELPAPRVVGRTQRLLQQRVDRGVAVPAGVRVAVGRLEVAAKHPLQVDELVDAEAYLQRVDVSLDAVGHVVLERLELLLRKRRVDPDGLEILLDEFIHLDAERRAGAAGGDPDF